MSKYKYKDEESVSFFSKVIDKELKVFAKRLVLKKKNLQHVVKDINLEKKWELDYGLFSNIEQYIDIVYHVNFYLKKMLVPYFDAIENYINEFIYDEKNFNDYRKLSIYTHLHRNILDGVVDQKKNEVSYKIAMLWLKSHQDFDENEFNLFNKYSSLKKKVTLFCDLNEINSLDTDSCINDFYNLRNCFYHTRSIMNINVLTLTNNDNFIGLFYELLNYSNFGHDELFYIEENNKVIIPQLSNYMTKLFEVSSILNSYRCNYSTKTFKLFYRYKESKIRIEAKDFADIKKKKHYIKHKEWFKKNSDELIDVYNLNNWNLETELKNSNTKNVVIFETTKEGNTTYINLFFEYINKLYLIRSFNKFNYRIEKNLNLSKITHI